MISGISKLGLVMHATVILKDVFRWMFAWIALTLIVRNPHSTWSVRVSNWGYRSHTTGYSRSSAYFYPQRLHSVISLKPMCPPMWLKNCRTEKRYIHSMKVQHIQDLGQEFLKKFPWDYHGITWLSWTLVYSFLACRRQVFRTYRLYKIQSFGCYTPWVYNILSQIFSGYMHFH